MSYSARICITIPAALYHVGCAIARALDPDVGGAENFGPRQRMDESGEMVTPTEYTTGLFPCTENFLQQAPALMASPPMLHAVVSADYAARWPDLTPPTLAECEAFCAGVELFLPNNIIPQ